MPPAVEVRSAAAAAEPPVGQPAARPSAAHEPTGLATRETRSLGSRLRLVACGRGGLEAGWAAILEEFAAVDAAMSRFRDDSEITLLNRAGRAPSLSGRLRAALVLSDRARRATNGRFDPRVLQDLERLGFAGAPVGRHAGRETPRAPSGDRVLCSADAGFGLPVPVDLGGIGKGLALRWSAAAAAPHLREAFLIDAGGDLVTRGEPPGGWSIGIEDPIAGGQVATCSLGADQAIATSSVRIGRRMTPEGLVHHLVDPRSGEPGGRGLAAVTVAGPDPAWAEVWSKALFLAGAGSIGDEARARGLAAWWIGEDGTISMTPAARAVTTWVRDEAPGAGS